MICVLVNENVQPQARRDAAGALKGKEGQTVAENSIVFKKWPPFRKYLICNILNDSIYKESELR
jgi:hypothetical protein